MEAGVVPPGDHLLAGGCLAELNDEGVELFEFFLDEVEGGAEAFGEGFADGLSDAGGVDDPVVVGAFRFQGGDGGGGDAVCGGVRFLYDGVGTLDDEFGFCEELLVAEALPFGFGEVNFAGFGFAAFVGEPEGECLGEDEDGVFEFGFLTLFLIGDATEAGLLFFCRVFDGLDHGDGLAVFGGESERGGVFPEGKVFGFCEEVERAVEGFESSV